MPAHPTSWNKLGRRRHCSGVPGSSQGPLEDAASVIAQRPFVSGLVPEPASKFPPPAAQPFNSLSALGWRSHGSAFSGPSGSSGASPGLSVPAAVCRARPCPVSEPPQPAEGRRTGHARVAVSCAPNPRSGAYPAEPKAVARPGQMSHRDCRRESAVPHGKPGCRWRGLFRCAPGAPHASWPRNRFQTPGRRLRVRPARARPRTAAEGALAAPGNSP